MARRRRNPDSEATPDLAASAPSAPSHDPLTTLSPPAATLSAPANGQGILDGSVAIPLLLEYQPTTANGRWRVERFELMAAEFFDIPAPQGTPSPIVSGFWQACASTFHDLLSSYPRQWLICRRLFGIAPLIPPADAQCDDLRSWPRTELQENLGISAAELTAELNAVRAVWRQSRPAPVAPTATAPTEARAELNFGDDVLREFGFDEQMFDALVYDKAESKYIERATALNRMEREWFIERVRTWKKMLSEPMAATLAREALMNELHLRRLSQEMSRHMPGSPRFRELIADKKSIETVYLEQLGKLDEVFPWESAIGGKISFRGCISELVDAYQKYKEDGSTALVDKIHTAAEVEILLRMSVQIPVPRYRLGLNTYLIEAQHGLHDPQWRTQLKPSVLRKLDVAFQESIIRLREESNETLVDLEKDGADGEFPDVGPLPAQPSA